MSIMPDWWIERKAKEGMIEPFAERADRPGVISYGLSSYGYDVRVADHYKLFRTTVDTPETVVIDPKNFDGRLIRDHNGPYLLMPPHSFALTTTVERFKIPRNVLVVCVGKSTYARCGLIINVTPLEPEWEGHITIEISNTTGLPAIVYSNEGIAQLLFFQSKIECIKSYADKKGKYQGQTDITLPRL